MLTVRRDPEAIAVRTVELSEPLHPLSDVTAYNAVRVFVLRDGCPIGSVDIPNHYQPVSLARLRDTIVDRLAFMLVRPLVARELGGTEERPSAPSLRADVSASVVVATYDRPDDLRKCLRYLSAQESPRPVEIVVVDNHPASGLTPAVVAEFPGVVLVDEPRQGLAYARNAGFVAATGDILIATDDDVTIPAGWLEKIVAPFADPEVMAVTGNVLPLELETRAQVLFESYGGLGRGFYGWVADRDWFTRCARAVPTWKIGATANAAFRASIFAHPKVGLMHEPLGPGMPSGVGEDAYLFYKILEAGYKIAYDPAAYVWHRHRRDMKALRRQLYAYSKGHVAYQLTTLFRDRDRRALVRLGYELPRGYLWYLKRRLFNGSHYPLAMVGLEVLGHLNGPWALWRSHRRVRREGRSGPYVAVAERPATAASRRTAVG